MFSVGSQAEEHSRECVYVVCYVSSALRTQKRVNTIWPDDHRATRARELATSAESDGAV